MTKLVVILTKSLCKTYWYRWNINITYFINKMYFFTKLEFNTFLVLEVDKALLILFFKLLLFFFQKHICIKQQGSSLLVFQNSGLLDGTQKNSPQTMVLLITILLVLFSTSSLHPLIECWCLFCSFSNISSYIYCISFLILLNLNLASQVKSGICWNALTKRWSYTHVCSNGKWDGYFVCFKFWLAWDEWKSNISVIWFWCLQS